MVDNGKETDKWDGSPNRIETGISCYQTLDYILKQCQFQNRRQYFQTQLVIFCGETIKKKNPICFTEKGQPNSKFTFITLDLIFCLFCGPKLVMLTLLRVGLDGQDDTIRLFYFLSHVTVFYYIVIIIFILYANKHSVYPNQPFADTSFCYWTNNLLL